MSAKGFKGGVSSAPGSRPSHGHLSVDFFVCSVFFSVRLWAQVAGDHLVDDLNTLWLTAYGTGGC